MEKKYLELYKKFDRIRKLGWIESMRNGPTGVGYTFETLLNKKEDNIRQPDFNNIEIKTMKYFSKRKIHLFNLTPESNSTYTIKSIVNSFGYPDKTYPKYKVFNVSINTRVPTIIGYKKFRLKVDKENKKILLIATSIFGVKKKLNVYWNFDKLEEALLQKLQYLAIVKACTRKNKEKELYYYTRIDFYKLKSFDYFIDLIEKGIITITFKIGIKKEPEKFGQIHDKGTDFSILEKNIELLFEKQ